MLRSTELGEHQGVEGSEGTEKCCSGDAGLRPPPPLLLLLLQPRICACCLAGWLAMRASGANPLLLFPAGCSGGGV